MGPGILSEIVVGAEVVVPDDFVRGAGRSVGGFAFIGSGCVVEDNVRISTRATGITSEQSWGAADRRLMIQSGAIVGAIPVVEVVPVAVELG